MQTVGDIGVGCAGIEIEEKQRQMRVEIFVTAFYSFTDNMVRYTAERLQRDHFVDAVIQPKSCLEQLLAITCRTTAGYLDILPECVSHSLQGRMKSLQRVAVIVTIIREKQFAFSLIRTSLVVVLPMSIPNLYIVYLI